MLQYLPRGFSFPTVSTRGLQVFSCYLPPIEGSQVWGLPTAEGHWDSDTSLPIYFSHHEFSQSVSKPFKRSSFAASGKLANWQKIMANSAAELCACSANATLTVSSDSLCLHILQDA